MDIHQFNKKPVLLFLMASCLTVSAVKFTFTEYKVLQERGTVVMTCAVNETDVKKLYNVQIQSIRGNTTYTLGTLELDGLTPTIPANFTDRITFNGSFDADTPTNTHLNLTIDKEKIQCSDGTQYVCSLAYFNVDNANVRNVQNGTLEVYSYPSISSLTGKHNGTIVDGASPGNKTSFEVGEQLELTCSADVGSIPETHIRWRKLVADGRWEQQSVNDSTETEAQKDGCGYTKTAIILYTTTLNDAYSEEGLVFECYVRVTDLPYTNYETVNNPSFFADVWTNITTTPTTRTTTITTTLAKTTQPANSACNTGYSAMFSKIRCRMCAEIHLIALVVLLLPVMVT